MPEGYSRANKTGGSSALPSDSQSAAGNVVRTVERSSFPIDGQAVNDPLYLAIQQAGKLFRSLYQPKEVPQDAQIEDLCAYDEIASGIDNIIVVRPKGKMNPRVLAAYASYVNYWHPHFLRIHRMLSRQPLQLP